MNRVKGGEVKTARERRVGGDTETGRTFQLLIQEKILADNKVEPCWCCFRLNGSSG